MLRIITPIMRIVEIPMLALQRLLGINRLAWAFLLPNLVLFGLFAFLPVIVNVFYATTGGDNVLLVDRPYVGARNFNNLMDCSNFLDPNSCREDKFWRAVWNTTWFVTLQVGIMVGFSLLTAIILNRCRKKSPVCPQGRWTSVAESSAPGDLQPGRPFKRLVNKVSAPFPSGLIAHRSGPMV